MSSRITIQAPISNFVIKYSGNPFCSFGIVPAGNRHALLGNNFLRNCFTVFDISNNKISLAARNFSSSTEEVVPVPAGGVLAMGVTGTTKPSETGTAPAIGSATAATNKWSAFSESVSYYTVPLVLFSITLAA